MGLIVNDSNVFSLVLQVLTFGAFLYTLFMICLDTLLAVSSANTNPNRAEARSLELLCLALGAITTSFAVMLMVVGVWFRPDFIPLEAGSLMALLFFGAMWRIPQLNIRLDRYMSNQ